MPSCKGSSVNSHSRDVRNTLGPPFVWISGSRTEQLPGATRLLETLDRGLRATKTHCPIITEHLAAPQHTGYGLSPPKTSKPLNSEPLNPKILLTRNPINPKKSLNPKPCKSLKTNLNPKSPCTLQTLNSEHQSFSKLLTFSLRAKRPKPRLSQECSFGVRLGFQGLGGLGFRGFRV